MSSSFKSSPIFDYIKKGIDQDPSLSSKVKASFLYELVSADGKTKMYWVVNLKEHPGSVQRFEVKEKAGKADVEIRMKDADFYAMATGKLKAQTAFMTGKLKIRGNVILAQKMQVVLSTLKKTSKTQKGQVATSKLSASSEFAADKAFAELKKRIGKDTGTLARKVSGTYCFKVKKGDLVRSWVVDMRSTSSPVREIPSGEKATGDCIIKIADDNLVLLMSGKLDPQTAFMQGKLKVAGNLLLAQKLESLITESKMQSKL